MKRIDNRWARGIQGIIGEMEYSHPACKKLIDMGVTPGCFYTVEGTAPFGSPIRINIRGYSLAVRKSDLKAVKSVKIVATKR